MSLQSNPTLDRLAELEICTATPLLKPSREKDTGKLVAAPRTVWQEAKEDELSSVAGFWAY